MLRPKGGLREARHSLRDSGEYVERAGLSRLPPAGGRPNSDGLALRGKALRREPQV